MDGCLASKAVQQLLYG